MAEAGEDVNRCDWAACSLPAYAWEDGYYHCADHLLEHRDEWHPPAPRPRPTHNRPVKPCGTVAAYKRHLKYGEECDPCRRANTTRTALVRAINGRKKRAA